MPILLLLHGWGNATCQEQWACDRDYQQGVCGWDYHIHHHWWSLDNPSIQRIEHQPTCTVWCQGPEHSATKNRDYWQWRGDVLFTSALEKKICTSCFAHMLVHLMITLFKCRHWRYSSLPWSPRPYWLMFFSPRKKFVARRKLLLSWMGIFLGNLMYKSPHDFLIRRVVDSYNLEVKVLNYCRKWFCESFAGDNIL